MIGSTCLLVWSAYKSIFSSFFSEPPSTNRPKPPSWQAIMTQQHQETQTWKVAYEKKKKTWKPNEKGIVLQQNFIGQPTK